MGHTVCHQTFPVSLSLTPMESSALFLLAEKFMSVKNAETEILAWVASNATNYCKSCCPATFHGSSFWVMPLAFLSKPTTCYFFFHQFRFQRGETRLSKVKERSEKSIPSNKWREDETCIKTKYSKNQEWLQTEKQDWLKKKSRLLTKSMWTNESIGVLCLVSV